ncbi:MAG: cell division protein SepF [Anaeroplasmataceae bacterium]|nr:cell division protein SepF [Anaeroplasmataceae bacterium]MDE6414704.1 cell division protein SepF [Anaeroplasmataceae bacterium]
MGLFGKKRNEYEEASKNLSSEDLASERIIMEQINDDDAKAAELVKRLRKGDPLVLNFDNLEPMAANKLLAFFAGATFALDGKSVMINEKTYLFALKSSFMDGSLQEFLNQL